MNFIEEVKAAIIDNDNSANRINNNDEEFDEALLNEDIYDPEEEEKNSHFSWMARK